MSRSRVVVVPPHWASFYESSGIPAGIRIDHELTLTGHTGDTPDGFPPEHDQQLRQTFRNIGETLSHAGATWADVVELRSYHVGIREQSTRILEIAAEFLESPLPAWTAIGVVALFEPDALVEISCRAVRDVWPD